MLHGDDFATSCRNLVNFDVVTMRITRVTCAVFAATLPQFGDPPSFSTLAFRDALQYHNSDYRILIGNNFSASCRNIV